MNDGAFIGGIGFVRVLQSIATENDARRRRDEDVPWTWDQWDRLIAAGEKYGVPGYLRHGFDMTIARVTKAKKDGVSAEFFHNAMKVVGKRSVPKAIFQPARMARGTPSNVVRWDQK